MFKSPLVRKVTFELLPAALLSFTGSILVAQYFRPAVVITPPSNEASIREDLIRTLRQERAIIHDYMTKIAATNAFNAPARNPADAEAKAPSNGPKTVGLVTSPSSHSHGLLQRVSHQMLCPSIQGVWRVSGHRGWSAGPQGVPASPCRGSRPCLAGSVDDK